MRENRKVFSKGKKGGYFCFLLSNIRIKNSRFTVCLFTRLKKKKKKMLSVLKGLILVFIKRRV